MRRTNWGVFSQGLAAPASFAAPAQLDLAVHQFLPAASNGVRIKAEKIRQLPVATVAQLEGLEGGIQATLLLIQEAVKQEDGGLQFMGRKLQPGDIGEQGNRFRRASGEHLSPTPTRFRRGVKVKAGDKLARNLSPLDQVAQRVVHLDLQRLCQFLGEVALRGTIQEGFGGSQQRAVAGKADRMVEPQAVVIEGDDLAEGVIATAIRVAGEVVEGLKLTEDGDIDAGSEGALEFVQGCDLVLAEMPPQRGRGKGSRSHNVIVPSEINL